MRKKSFLWFIFVSFTPFILTSCTSKANNESRNLEKNQKIFFNFPISISNKCISDNVQDLVNKKLNNRMLFGTEAMLLNKIEIFNDENSKTREARFLKVNNTIKVNLNIAFKNKILNEYDLAEYIFQIISHEYKHFQAEIYLKNINNPILTTSDIFSYLSEQKWPLAYVNKFKSLLKYNQNTPKYHKEEVKKGFISLGSIYNQKELFEIANSKNNHFAKLKGNEVMTPLNPEVPVDNKHVITDLSLKYIYTMEELYARKNQLATESIFVTKKHNYGLNRNGWFVENNKKYWSPYLQDVVNFKRNLQSQDGQYLNDNPLNENREAIKNLFKESINYGIDGLTLLQFEKDKSKIVIGGQIDLDFKPTKLIVKDKKGMTKFSLNVFSKNQNFWIAKEVPISIILNKNLFLEDASNKEIPISKLKKPEYGAPSTFKFYIKNKKNYEAKIIDNNVQIIETK